MMRLFSWFNNIGIRNKLIIVYISCVMIPTLVGGFIWITVTGQEMDARETQSLDNTAERVVTNFRQIIQSSVDVTNQISTDITLARDLDKSFDDFYSYYEFFYRSLRSRFDMYLLINSNFANITMFTSNPNHSNSSYFQYLSNAVREDAWYIDYTTAGSHVRLTPMEASAFLSTHSRYLRITQRVRRSTEPFMQEQLVTVDLKMERILSEIALQAGEMEIYVLKDDQVVYMTPISNRAEIGEQVSLSDKSNLYRIKKPLGDSSYFKGWSILGVYDRSLLVRQRYGTFMYIIGWTTLFAIISVVILTLVLNSVVVRITLLANHMKKITRKNFARLDYSQTGTDEVGLLIRFFNNMIGEINRLINDVYKLEVRQKAMELEHIRAELQYLQSQANPHFLFNTLNAIMVVCVKKGYTEVVEVIQSLSKLLRRLLDSGDKLIALKEEFDFIEKYLMIEKFRFGEKFYYEIILDPEVEQTTIPRMLIQPLVENACIHGLQLVSGRQRVLKLSASKQPDGAIRILVEDNGIGVEEGALEAMRMALKNPNESEGVRMGIGLQNVYRRIKLHYSGSAALTLDSRVGEGMTVTILLRKEAGENGQGGEKDAVPAIHR